MRDVVSKSIVCASFHYFFRTSRKTRLNIFTIGQQIFAMYVRGDRICEIQSWLQDNKILTVGELRYRRTGSTRHPRPQLEAYYNWPDKTLYDILSRKEYLGHTITGKTRKVSYKSKKTIKNTEDKQYFFPNTHEALIDGDGHACQRIADILSR